MEIEDSERNGLTSAETMSSDDEVDVANAADAPKEPEQSEASMIKELQDRATSLEQSQNILTKKVRMMGGLIRALLLIVAVTITMSKLGLPKEHLHLKNYVDPTRKMPFYMVWIVSVGSTVIGIRFIGPPKLRPDGNTGDEETLKAKAKWLLMRCYQFCKVGILCHSLLCLFYESFQQTRQFRKDFPDREISVSVWYAANVVVAKAVCGAAFSNSVEIFALFQLVMGHAQFVRRHAKELSPSDVYPGDLWTFEQIVQSNGYIAAVYFGLGFFFMWPIALIICMAYLAPVFMMYIWFFGPVMMVLMLAAMAATELIIFMYKRIGSKARHRVNMYGVNIKPLKRKHANRVRSVLTGESGRGELDDMDWNKYEEELDCFFTSGFHRRGWKVFLASALTLPTVAPMMAITGVRLYTGHKYLDALKDTVMERHYYDYFSYAKDVVAFAAAFCGLY